MVIVRKHNGEVRICVDLTDLNKFVEREVHPLPAGEQVFGQLTGARHFSKIDANSGFWQFELSEESQALTTFITPFGRFKFKRLPFGISSAPEFFQKMSQFLNGLEGVVYNVEVQKCSSNQNTKGNPTFRNLLGFFFKGPPDHAEQQQLQTYTF